MTVTGLRAILEVPRDQGAEKLFEKVASWLRVPSTAIRLIYQGRQIQSSQLSHYPESPHQLWAVIKLRGGTSTA